jgi:GNAT superfamily N-acetyltransferase
VIPEPVRIRELQTDDWVAFRDIRLAMLEEIPIAFGETLAEARAMTDAQWRSRVRGYTSGSGLRLGAVAPDGRWVGTMGGFIEAGRPMLVGVYVMPSHRGRAAGVTDALLELVERWATQYSSTLRLRVHEDNLRARAAYVSRGFVEDGTTSPYPLDPSRMELQMVKRLAT